MGQHIAHSHAEIDAVVYEQLRAKGAISYPKCLPQQLFKELGIIYRFRHDVFCALKRLEANGCIEKRVVETRPQTLGRVKHSAARRVTYVAIKPPEEISAKQPEEVYALL